MRAARLARDLAEILKSGASLPEALGQAAEGADPAWATPLRKAREAALEGAPLAEALRAQGCFPNLLVEGVQGQPEVPALEQVAALLDETELRQRRLRASLSYPFFLLTAGLVLSWLCSGVLGAILHELSLFSALTHAADEEFLRAFRAPLVLTLESGLLVLGFALLSGKLGMNRLRLRLPILGSWLRRSESVVWLEWLDYLLACGRPLPEAMRQAARASQDAAWVAAVDAAANMAEKGHTLSKATESERLLPLVAQTLLAHGQTLELPRGYLSGIARAMRRELEADAQVGLTAAERLGLVAAALLLGPMLLSLYQGFAHFMAGFS